MAFDIEFTPTAAAQVRAYRKSDQGAILNGIEDQLRNQPTTETRHKKRLTENEFSDWELRVGSFRVFYDVIVGEESRVVKIKAVGHKEHNRLFVSGQEVKL